ncbi:lipopolysaccharide biosynthesis protein [Gordonia amicalis]|uniref:lipopolysaccharide biosynthesis protein n=1 Tax=Gordonia amicalis TaxID=89053 RepID=UPI00387DCFFC
MTRTNEAQGLGQSAARGVLVTVGGQVVRLGLQVFGVVILSRLLTPGDFGLMAMIAVLITMGQAIRDFGLSNAAIQVPDITDQQRTNLFWMNVALGVLVAAVACLTAPLVAGFYSAPELVPVILAMSSVFVIFGLMTQSRAHLARELRFGALMITDVLPAVVGLILAVVFAALGVGVWALVIQQVSIAGLGLVLAFGYDRWLPRLPRRDPRMGYFLKYGSFLTLSAIVASLSRNADYVILGYRFGPAATGFYTRAFELVINPLNQINAPSSKVAVPVLSRLQDDRSRYDEFLLAGQKTMLAVLVPILVLGIVIADPLVQLVLGPEWASSAVLLQVLIVAALCRVASYACYWVALSRGATRVDFLVNLVSAPLLIICVLIGSLEGVVGVAWGFSVATAFSWVIALVWYSRAASAPGWKMFLNACSTFSASVLPALVSAGVISLVFAESSDLVKTSVGSIVFCLGLGAQAFFVPSYRRDWSNVVRVARLVRSRHGNSIS